MRLWKLAAIVGAFVASIGAASADKNWSGPYAGVVVSGGLFTVEQEDYWCWYACNAPTLQDWDASVGVQGGFNWQTGNAVLGIVADWSTGFEQEETVIFSPGTPPFNGVVWNAEWSSYGTIRGQAGLAAGNALLFVTGGIAIVDVDYSAHEINTGVIDCAVNDCADYSDTNVGFAAGAGFAMPVTDNVDVRFEYLYIGLPWYNDIYNTANPGTDDYVSWTTSAHLARLSAVWEFD